MRTDSLANFTSSEAFFSRPSRERIARGDVLRGSWCVDVWTVLEIDGHLIDIWWTSWTFEIDWEAKFIGFDLTQPDRRSFFFFPRPLGIQWFDQRWTEWYSDSEVKYNIDMQKSMIWYDMKWYDILYICWNCVKFPICVASVKMIW